jgi:membrane fusion protein (multidrug efflux system)
MIKRMIIMLIIVGIILGGIFGFISFKGRMIKEYMASQGEPIHTVSTITANAMDWLPKMEAVGSLQASQGTNVSAEVPGMPLLQLRAKD